MIFLPFCFLYLKFFLLWASTAYIVFKVNSVGEIELIPLFSILLLSDVVPQNTLLLQMSLHKDLEAIHFMNFLGLFQVLYLDLVTTSQNDTFIILELASTLFIKQSFTEHILHTGARIQQ